MATQAWSEAPGVRRASDGSGLWIDHQVPAEAWETTGLEGVWTAERPHGQAFQKVSVERLGLRDVHGVHAQDTSVVRGNKLGDLENGEFAVIGDRIYLCSSGRPGDQTFSVFRPRRMEVSTRRAVVGTLTGAGLPIWPGEEQRFQVDLSLPRALEFYAAAEALGSEAHAEAQVEFVVKVEGQELSRTALRAPAEVGGQWVEVELPVHGAEAELTLAVEGQLAVTGFFAPTLAPLEHGQPGARPWGETRPNLILFVADTFRADNLAAYGGEAGRTPRLDALAADSRLFRRAWSTAAWTLPSHGSMFTGLYPEQHGASDEDLALSTQLETLTEQLRQHGYRTGAVTDSGFVSRNFGFDQGFDWFLELKRWDLRKTLRAATEFVEADDGRPFFLFVQTYRTHSPYRTGVDEDSTDLKRLMQEATQRSAEFGGSGEWPREETGRRFHDLYLEGVAALDRQFGTWMDELVGGRVFDPGYMVFTSDHGEAFYEHTEMGHGGILWEEKLRIPLFIHGHGIEAGETDVSASLVDLMPTLARLARVPLSTPGEGRDLLQDPEDGPLYSFARLGDRSMFAVLEGSRKLYGLADPALLARGECKAATDLALDPLEAHDASQDQAWPAEMCRAQSETLERLLDSLVPAVVIELSPDDRNFLDDIGYGD